jgi:hypothetical protein
MLDVARWLAFLLLAASGAMGVYNGIYEWDSPRSPLQRSVTICIVVYGVLGLLGAVGLLRRARWTAWATAAWGVVITYVGAMAAIAYAPDATTGGAVAAGVITAVIAVFVVWTAERTTIRE